MPAEAVEVSSTRQQDTVQESSVESEDSPYGEALPLPLRMGQRQVQIMSSRQSLNKDLSPKNHLSSEEQKLTSGSLAETAEAAGFRLPNSMQTVDADSEEGQIDNDGENE